MHFCLSSLKTFPVELSSFFRVPKPKKACKASTTKKKKKKLGGIPSVVCGAVLPGTGWLYTKHSYSTFILCNSSAWSYSSIFLLIVSLIDTGKKLRLMNASQHELNLADSTLLSALLSFFILLLPKCKEKKSEILILWSSFDKSYYCYTLRYTIAMQQALKKSSVCGCGDWCYWSASFNTALRLH